MDSLDFRDLFQQLLNYRDQTNDFSKLGPWLQQHMATGVWPNLDHIPVATQTYTRQRIAREHSVSPTTIDPSFEALMVDWNRQAKTPIHGHPSFSFYHVITGIFEMELFTNTTQGLQFVKKQLFLPSDNTWCVGPSGKYDNFIHRVTCLEAGQTFHIYSDDAQKGVCFELATGKSLEAASNSSESCQKI